MKKLESIFESAKKTARNATLATAIATSSLLSSCISLTDRDREVLERLETDNKEIEQVKDPYLAGFLNLLPGFGNFYLAYGTDRPEQSLIAVLNLFTWPYSVLWGVPQAAIDANTINKKASVMNYGLELER